MIVKPGEMFKTVRREGAEGEELPRSGLVQNLLCGAPHNRFVVTITDARSARPDIT